MADAWCVDEGSDELARLARLDTPVLIGGETGVGKGRLARRLHALSGRTGPFAPVDCGGLSPGVFESELFGHERGAFTGALTRHAGRLERAAAGTLFIDEVAELPASLQVKLLRVLQERAFERVGGVRTLRLDARVVVATHRDLVEEVRAGRFRADLYFRIAVATLVIPPLRERPGAFGDLLDSGLRRIPRRLGLAPPRLTDGGRERLRAHAWPGNVRELMNVLERLAIRHPGARVGADEAAAVLDTAFPFPDARGELDARPVDGARVAEVLVASGGNVARAARTLGMPRTTLRRRLARLSSGREGAPALEDHQA